jgi:hypothetical protein
VSLRAQWKSIGEFTERCPEASPEALVTSWAIDGTSDVEALSGLKEHEECKEMSSCRPGAPLPPVPVQVSKCQRGQLLVNYRPTVSGRYAFILDAGGSIGRSAPWSVSVAAMPPNVSMSTATFRDLMMETPGGGQSAVAGQVGSLQVQARDKFGNANYAQCLSQVEGHLTYERDLTSKHLKHGGSSISALEDSSPESWPYSPNNALERLDPVVMDACDCVRGRTILTFVAPISGIYRIRIEAAVPSLADETDEEDDADEAQPGMERERRDAKEEVLGSGELVEVFPSFQNLSVGAHQPNLQRVAHGRWRYYWLHLPEGAVGFQLSTSRYSSADGQPWIFIQQGMIPTQPRGPFLGVPDAGASAQGCYHCRAHVLLARETFEQSSAGDGRQTSALGKSSGNWYAGVYGGLASVAFRLSSHVYRETFLLPDTPTTGTLEAAGHWHFFDLDLLRAGPKIKNRTETQLKAGEGAAKVVGFTIVIRVTSSGSQTDGNTATLLAAAQRRDQGYPLKSSNAREGGGGMGGGLHGGAENVMAREREWQDHRVLNRKQCRECVLSYNTGEQLQGSDLRWRLGIMSEGAQVRFQVILSVHRRRHIRWGMQGLELSHVGPFSSQEFETYFDESLYDAFRVQLITEISSSATTVVMGKGSVPVGSNDEFFPGLACAACRAVVQSSANLTGTWTVVVRGGSRGGDFSLSTQLVRTCANRCSGNGRCVRRNTYACQCFPGYDGSDCSLAVPAKTAAWYPFFSDLLDRSENDLRLTLQAQPAINNLPPSESVRLAADDIGGHLEMLGGYLETEGRPTSRTHCTAGDKKESLDYLAEEDEGKVRAPALKATLCATYDVAHEFAVMAWFYASEKPSNNSGITMGARLWQASISPSNDQFAWSFMLSLIGHPREDEPGFFVNFAVNQEDSGIGVRIASARDLDSFPERGWPEPRWDPILATHRWVHLAGVYAKDRIQLFIDGKLQAEVRAPMRKMRSVSNAVVHIGHDSRYPSTSRVHYGKIKDVRLLRYPPVAAEILMVAKGLYTLPLLPRVETTPDTAASGHHHDNLGSAARPVLASQDADLSQPSQVFLHEDFCSLHARIPNEQWDEAKTSDSSEGRYHACRFQGQTSWVPKRGVSSPYRHAQIAKSTFGIGSIFTVMADREQ